VTGQYARFARKDITVVVAAFASTKIGDFLPPSHVGDELVTRKKPHVTYVALEAVIPVRLWSIT
jgi:hypothetical protein